MWKEEGSGAGVQIVLTSRKDAPEDDRVLPINYEEFPSMCMQGDTIFLGRYLVTGSEESSCYLTVGPAVTPRNPPLAPSRLPAPP